MENQEVKIPQGSEPSTAKIAAKPLAKGRVGSLFSIEAEIDKKKLSENQPQATNTDENLPNNHFTNTDLENEWQIFIQNLKKEDIVIYSAINNFIISKLDENTIEVAYPSETARVEFDKVRDLFFNHFRHKVNHFKIEITYKLTPSLKTEILTKRKLFDKLAEINPVLKNLNELMRFDFS